MKRHFILFSHTHPPFYTSDDLEQSFYHCFLRPNKLCSMTVLNFIVSWGVHVFLLFFFLKYNSVIILWYLNVISLHVFLNYQVQLNFLFVQCLWTQEPKYGVWFFMFSKEISLWVVSNVSYSYSLCTCINIWHQYKFDIIDLACHGDFLTLHYIYYMYMYLYFSKLSQPAAMHIYQ